MEFVSRFQALSTGTRVHIRRPCLIPGQGPVELDVVVGSDNYFPPIHVERQAEDAGVSQTERLIELIRWINLFMRDGHCLTFIKAERTDNKRNLPNLDRWLTGKTPLDDDLHHMECNDWAILILEVTEVATA